MICFDRRFRSAVVRRRQETKTFDLLPASSGHRQHGSAVRLFDRSGNHYRYPSPQRSAGVRFALRIGTTAAASAVAACCAYAAFAKHRICLWLSSSFGFELHFQSSSSLRHRSVQLFSNETEAEAKPGAGAAMLPYRERERVERSKRAA